ncbi:MAG TPA: hypothetical protein VGT08_18990 [Terracidiphilus sp.]|nr:hypothetical protein [Terracidiphilus sp.]
MKKTFRPVEGHRERTGKFQDHIFKGWEYQEGWCLRIQLPTSDIEKTLWVDGTFQCPGFYRAPQIAVGRPDPEEFEADLVDIPTSQREAILGMIWEWEVWEPVTEAGTCAIESLEHMLELPRETLLDWFRRSGRNPSVPDDIMQVLTDNEYLVETAGPEGFGRFRDFRRLVTMFRKDDPASGHVVLIYEDDRDIFDASGRFKKVGDIIVSSQIGYNRGPVWKVEKA